MKIHHALSLACIFWLAACTDAEWAQVSALAQPSHIVCYSGGQVFFEADSTGKIATEEGSDGWFFNDAKTGNLVRLSGDCVVTINDTRNQ